MKMKVILLVFCAAAISAKYLSSNENEQSSLLLYNIEALAADEHAAITHCIGKGDLECPITKKKVKYIFGGYSLEDLY